MKRTSPKRGVLCKATSILTVAFFVFSGIPIPVSFAETSQPILNETGLYTLTKTLEQANNETPVAIEEPIPSGVAIREHNPLSPATPDDTDVAADTTETEENVLIDQPAAPTVQNYEYERYEFEDALDLLRPEYASAVIIKDLIQEDLKKLAELPFETAVIVIAGEIVIFTTGNSSEIGILQPAQDLLKEATFISHTHRNSGPSSFDLAHAVAAPGTEYIVTGEGVYVYNSDGLIVGKDAFSLDDYLGHLHAAVQAEQESNQVRARSLLNRFIKEMDLYNAAEKTERTVFRQAAISWTGSGGNTLWSNAANWSGGVVPVAGDSVTFTGAVNCTIDTAVNVANITLDSNFTGTITQRANVTITNNYVQQAGKWVDATPTQHTFTVGNSFSIPTAPAAFNRYGPQINGAYQVRDVFDLQAMQGYLTSNFKLTRDLDASNTANWNGGTGFEPIGYTTNDPWFTKGVVKSVAPTHAFRGIFNGGEHTISGLTIDRPDENGLGLFAYTASGATVRDVGLLDVHITGGYGVAGIVGGNLGTVNNCYLTGQVAGYRYVGGIVGGNVGIILDSHSSAAMNGTEDVGGLAGTTFGKIDNSYATGNVIGNDRAENIGGLAGSGKDPHTILNSFATGNVSAGDKSKCVGGLVGDNTGGSITNSFSTGSVTVGDGDFPEGSINYTEQVSQIGGFTGYNGGSITKSYALGNVSASDNGFGFPANDVGGFVGSNDAIISDSYAQGNVMAGNVSSSVGGFAGYNSNAITRAYSTGSVSVGSDSFGTGGLVGYNSKTGSISNSFTVTSFVGGGHGSYDTGGLVGYNNGGTITNSYFTDGVYNNGLGTYEWGGENAFYGSAHAVYNAAGSKWDLSNVWRLPDRGLPLLRSTMFLADFTFVQPTVYDPDAVTTFEGNFWLNANGDSLDPVRPKNGILTLVSNNGNEYVLNYNVSSSTSATVINDIWFDEPTDLSSGLTVAMKGPRGVKVMVTVIDENYRCAKFFISLDDVYRNFYFDFSDSPNIPEGFDPSRILAVQYSWGNLTCRGKTTGTVTIKSNGNDFGHRFGNLNMIPQKTYADSTGQTTRFDMIVNDEKGNLLYTYNLFGATYRPNGALVGYSCTFTLANGKGTLTGVFRNGDPSGTFTLSGTVVLPTGTQKISRVIEMTDEQTFLLDPFLVSDSVEISSHCDFVIGGFGTTTEAGDLTVTRFFETRDFAGRVTSFEENIYDALGNFLYKIARSGMVYVGNALTSYRETFTLPGNKLLNGIYANGKYVLGGTMLIDGISQAILRTVAIAGDVRVFYEADRTTDEARAGYLLMGLGDAGTYGDFTAIRYKETQDRNGNVTGFEEHVFDGDGNFLYKVVRTGVVRNAQGDVTGYRETFTIPLKGTLAGTYLNGTYKMTGALRINGVPQVVNWTFNVDTKRREYWPLNGPDGRFGLVGTHTLVIDPKTPGLTNKRDITIAYTIDGVARTKAFANLVDGKNELVITETDLLGNETTVVHELWVDTTISDFTWMGGTGTNLWSVGANWFGGKVPGVNDDVIFDSRNSVSCVVNVAATVKSLTIGAGYGGTITQNAALKVLGSFSQQSGTFRSGAATLDVDGDVALSGGSFTAPSRTFSVAGNFDQTGLGTFNHNNGTVVFDGVTNLRSAGNVFNNVQIGTPALGGRLTLLDNADFNGNFSVLNVTGATLFDLGGKTLNFAGANLNLTNLDLFNSAGGTVIFDGVTGMRSAGKALGNVQLGSATAGGRLTFLDNADIDGDFTVNEGGNTYLNVQNFSLNFSGAVLNFSGADDGYAGSRHKIIFDRTTTATELTLGGWEMGGIQIGSATSGGWLKLMDEGRFASNFSVGQGGTTTFDLNGQNLNFQGDNGTVNFSGLDSFTGWTDSNAIKFYNKPGTTTYLRSGGVKIGGNFKNTCRGSLKLLDALNIEGNFYNGFGNAAFFDANGQAVTISGSAWISNGIYYGRAGTQNFMTDLYIEGGTFTGATGAVNIGRDFRLNSGAINLGAQTVNVAGTARFSGGTAKTTSGAKINITGDTYYSGSTINMTGATLDIDGNFYWSAGNVSFSSLLRLAGNWTRTGGTVVGVRANTVEFNGTKNQTFSDSDPGEVGFYNLTYSGNQTLHILSPLCVAYAVTIGHGTVDLHRNDVYILPTTTMNNFYADNRNIINRGLLYLVLGGYQYPVSWDSL